MPAKSILKSKTFWTNVLMALVVPFLPASFALSPETLGFVFMGVNIVLRLISKGAVELV
jgi:hypothetical protein